jgi:hypothetical protein
MKTRIAVLTVMLLALLMGCAKKLSPEQQAQADALRGELAVVTKEVTDAAASSEQYSGGFLKLLTTMRLEILRTNQALIQQRIHAIESGTPVTVATTVTNPDQSLAKSLADEIMKQTITTEDADRKAAGYTGGLLGMMALMNAATERNTLAMLRQRFLVAKYGLAALPAVSPPKEDLTSSASAAEAHPKIAAIPEEPPAAKDPEIQLREQILDPILLGKKFTKQNYQDYIFFDIKFDPKGLDRPARAIKGLLRFTDLFDEQKFALRWTIEKPIVPGTAYTEKGSGFEYNQFADDHQWILTTEKENMKVKFRVDSILYEDGTKRTFD